ncbi:uncharacterized protein LOC110712120 isoform X2 [Chenopodium quinoa]|uniref:Uncharacterized protein n=2 Tax=Chenopodium quinoa TaxID=63459 RepID=A0A803M7U3_CHEQI|nr:uncharacterized protein LOC110712120 isoform X2 [Chenopodium quinoa]XP_021746240.1 uncharacterized protein LOC110712120 isoform X2 [Chenopodium quinoa]
MRLKAARLSRAASRAETGPTMVRSWDDLNYDILMGIINRVPWRCRLYVACLVSKSWLAAVLDSLSPGGVINLKVIDPHKLKNDFDFPRFQRRYLCFLKHMLDTKPVDSCSALCIGETVLKAHKYVYIAKRTPSLQRLVISEALGYRYSCFMQAMRYWRKLKKVKCPVDLFVFRSVCFEKVESLQLFGVVYDAAAIAIRDRCPRLRRLYLISCALSITALSTILDGHKRLEVLDTRHSFCVRDCKKTASIGISQSVEWNEEEIRCKAAGIKLHLRCTKQRCPKCSATWKHCYPKMKGRLANYRYWRYI